VDRIYEEIQQKKEHAEREARFYGDVLTELADIRKKLDENQCKHELIAQQDAISGKVLVRCRKQCGFAFQYAGYGERTY